MFRNYLTVALRNIIRHKLYSFINIAGLAVGLACVIFVILFVRDELSYDKWISDTENLYRLELTILVPDRAPMAMAMVPYMVPETMRDEIPGISGQTRLHMEGMTLSAGDRQFSEYVDVVDPGFFTLIRLPFVMGDPATVFRNPQSLVLTQSAARKYFGDANPMGRVLQTVRSNCAQTDTVCQHTMISLTVTGVIRDLPHNTQLSGDIFLPNTSIVDTMGQEIKHMWLANNGWGFIRLAPGVTPDSVMARINPILDRYVTPELKKFGVSGISGSAVYKMHMTRFDRVHLDGAKYSFNQTPPGSWTTVYGVAAIGLLILLVACFNFMNLSTARAALRAREIALRKTMGAALRQVMAQFLGEAVLMALLALVLAFAMVEILLPAFGGFLQRPIGFDYAHDWPLFLSLIGLAVVAGLISGFYPALVLSGFRPATTLRTNSAGQVGSGLLRNVLVVLQFAVSIGLGISAAVVFGQINYARNIDLGFRHDNVVTMGTGRMTNEQREAFVRALRSYPGIVSVGESDRVPFQLGQNLTLFQVPGQSTSATLNGIRIDPDFPRVYGIKVVAGRAFSESRADDRLHSLGGETDPQNAGKNILLNVAGARRLGFSPQEAIGKTVLYNKSPVRIVGVLADAKVQGARQPVQPSAYMYIPTDWMQLHARLRPDMVPQTLAFIDKTWRFFSPSVSIDRDFLDASYAKFYAADERQGIMFAAFVGLAILIACLGLFGLAAFTAGRRTKEIGIRKVFGAQTRNVILLLLWQFSIPVLIANAIAWPLAWYYLQGWLESYAYRISLNPFYFIGAGLVALVIAWVTIAGHAIAVARANPIKALRYE
ncbi:putative ABC transport system permease protein [Rhizomicrobium palustre]|uniref:Putative ABC transport system permease protein n=1 Tax=Rhizomicrobium palustre TaxID=189966 RepID=A0A846MVR8_9PROT|nr:ABC transporter permease [Rhizomicrobium palustre]NIK87150.1 putative ABC transport system permease protein [Rhizomicrobium palustre]